MRLSLAAAAALSIAIPAAAQEVDRSQINRIIDEGLNQSEVMETAAHLTDRIGGRMTNSPQMREAERWTQQRFRDWGLSNVHAEPFRFGRGWSIVRSSARMTAPRLLELGIMPVAWTPPTNGTLSAPILVAPIDEEEDFAEWRGKLSGRIVLVDQPDTGSELRRRSSGSAARSSASSMNISSRPIRPQRSSSGAKKANSARSGTPF